MTEDPWLTIIGLGEDGVNGLSAASLSALKTADAVMGAARHVDLISDLKLNTVTWPVPFADGIEQLLAMRGRRVVVLASGDPFWYGAGSVLSKHLADSEWRSIPGPSCFSWAASRMGWGLETVSCLGLHAAPLAGLRAHLYPGSRIIVTLRDGDSPNALGTYLTDAGFGETAVTILEALGGPREMISRLVASDLGKASSFRHPLCVALDVAGEGKVLTAATGREDDWFENDGQITKRPIRALTLSALAPKPGEHLWDIGGGSGSIAIEWVLAHPKLRATSIEANPKRCERIKRNAEQLGADRLNIIPGTAPEALRDLEPPDAVFVGGGLSAELLLALQKHAKGARLVANAVTLESEALLIEAHAQNGGDLTRIELADAAPLGTKRGWQSSYPIVQWSVTL